MRAFGLALVLSLLAAAAACTDPETNFGEANSIVGRELPGEGASSGGGGSTSTSSSGGGGGDPPAPTITMKAAHEGKGPPPGSKIDCLVCHKAGGTAPAFTYGGQSVAGAVISIPGTTAVKADADGYFWLAGGDMPANSKVTSTKAGVAKTMSSPLSAPTGGSCDSTNCHAQSSVPAI